MTSLFRFDPDSLPTNVKSSDFLEPAATTRTDHYQRLRIFIDDSNGDYKYKFDNDCILFKHEDDNIAFELINEIPNTVAAIVKHVSSDTNHPANANAKLIVLNPDPAVIPPNPISPDLAYPYNRARFMMSKTLFGEYEMIHIGLVVSIKMQNGKIANLLCDPQVGNGPP